jgi:hypothetical protein
MQEDYRLIIVESFEATSTSGHHGRVHIRPIPGQLDFPPDLFVECSKRLSNDFPIGTRFRIRAKLTRREGGVSFVYSNYRWRVEVLDKDNRVIDVLN